jgi:hypothetical protein
LRIAYGKARNRDGSGFSRSGSASTPMPSWRLRAEHPDNAYEGVPMHMLAHLLAVVSAAFAAVLMVRLGAAVNMLAVRRPVRCAACGVERHACRCGS